MQSLCALAKEKGTDNNASCGNSQDNDCPFLHYCQVCSVSGSGVVASEDGPDYKYFSLIPEPLI